MLAVKYYEETADELVHYYAMYTFGKWGAYVKWHSNYKSPWNKDLTLDELRKATGNDSISGIIHTDVNTFYMTEYESGKDEYFRFADEEFKKGKSIEQINADWIKQQKIDTITKSAKEFTC